MALWGCFWRDGAGPLVFVDGSMESEQYIQILADNFQSWLLDLQA